MTVLRLSEQEIAAALMMREHRRRLPQDQHQAADLQPLLPDVR
jgi:hypothetical protein